MWIGYAQIGLALELTVPKSYNETEMHYSCLYRLGDSHTLELLTRTGK